MNRAVRNVGLSNLLVNRLLSLKAKQQPFSVFVCRLNSTPKAFSPASLLSRSALGPVRCFAATAEAKAKGDGSSSTEDRNRRVLAYWLFTVTGMIFLIVVVGGITRLTESGLSITKWKPVVGMLPPMSAAEWQKEYELYKASPEFRQRDMANFTVEDFKKIFFWEWFHRVLGRCIGMAYIIPYIYFTKKGYIPKGAHPRLVALIALLGLQGAIGWIMVASGLDPKNFKDGNRVRVSHYRLTLHLGAAFTLYTGTLWTAMQLYRPHLTVGIKELMTAAPSLRRLSYFAAAWVFFTSMTGGFVAGLDAGQIYCEWPTMAGKFIPTQELYHLTPVWKSFFDHDTTVQFHHRMAAYTAVTLVALITMATMKVPLPVNVARARLAAQAAIVCQFVLGVTTLLSGARIELAATHQGGALALYTTLLWLAFTMRVKVPAF